MASPPSIPDEIRALFSEHNAEHVMHLAARLRLLWLLRHFHPRSVWAADVCWNCLFTTGMLSILAALTQTPFVFPSLGPTAYLFFFSPLAASSKPRHAILGHGIGLLCGYGSLWLTGTALPPHGISHGIDWPTVAAAAISLASTGALMVLLRVSHPPAGATTLIVSLGLISSPKDLQILEIAVVLLSAQAFLINRLAGLPFPVWERVA
jgi:CBS domain-containing membrane protein